MMKVIIYYEESNLYNMKIIEDGTGVRKWYLIQIFALKCISHCETGCRGIHGSKYANFCSNLASCIYIK